MIDYKQYIEINSKLRFGKPVVIRAVVENLLDDSYWASAARGFLAVGAPRTFIVSASVDF